MSLQRTTAPRGKEYAVCYMSRPIGHAKLLYLPGRWTELKDANRAVDTIDDRLTPVVVIVDRRPA